jgi:D-aspartate ligase
MDAQDRAGLAAIRCLHDAGYRVSGAATMREAPGLWAHGCSQRLILSEASRTTEFITHLERFLASSAHDVVLPGTDESLYVLSRHRERLAPYVRLGLPDHGAVERALDKRCLAREAAQLGLAAPEHYLCEGPDQAAVAGRQLGYPVLVKGSHTIEPRGNRLVRHKSVLACDEKGLLAAQRQIGQCIVQRREAGAVLSFGGVMSEQGLIGVALSRYERTWPPEAGSVCFSKTIAVPAGLVSQVERLVQAIGWRGLFELELMELSSGAIKAIDFNPRLYGSLTLAQAGGAPLTRIWCDSLLGKASDPALARPGISYRWEDADLRHALWQLRNHNYGKAVAALTPVRGAVHPYFRARDPLPFVVRGVELGSQRLRHLRGRS